VRQALGRGGLTTIQKHLVTLRAQAKAEEKNEPDAPPEMPSELMQSIWRAAWSEADKRQGKALRDALLRIDELEAQLRTAAADIEALTEAVERTEQERDEARAIAQDAVEQIARAEAKEAALDEMLSRVSAMLSLSNIEQKKSPGSGAAQGM
jgi:chromosome segregation ATPase